MRWYSWVESITRVLADNGGAASLQMLYENVGKYRDYSHYRKESDWQAALRGHLYREIRNDRHFKKIGLGIYALEGYKEKKRPRSKGKLWTHSFIEGICLELGNFEGFATYTADPSAEFKDNVMLEHLATVKEFPQFTYSDIIDEVKRIDVIWFNRKGLMFPQQAFEVIDSISTLSNALNRSCQLLTFHADFIIIGPEQLHKERFEQKIKLEPYVSFKERYKFRSYAELMEYYEHANKYNVLRKGFFSTEN